MTTIKAGGSWSSLLTPSPEADVQAVVRGVKAWLLRTGGPLLLEEAESVALPPVHALVRGIEYSFSHVDLPAAGPLLAAA